MRWLRRFLRRFLRRITRRWRIVRCLPTIHDEARGLAVRGEEAVLVDAVRIGPPSSRLAHRRPVGTMPLSVASVNGWKQAGSEGFPIREASTATSKEAQVTRAFPGLRKHERKAKPSYTGLFPSQNCE